MFKLNYSSEARDDLSAIKKYISVDLVNPDAASRVVTYITKRIRKLGQFPEVGTPLSSIVEIDTNYRFLVCENYLVFYRIEGNDVFIVRVLYGRRDYVAIIFGDLPHDNAK